MGISDAPNFLLWLFLALVPMHIFVALTGDHFLALFGYGPVAIGFQVVALFSVIAILGPFLILSTRRPIWLRIVIFCGAYVTAVLATNLIPTIPSFLK